MEAPTAQVAPATPASPDEARAAEARRFLQVTSLLGGKRVFRRQPQSRLDAHEIIARGLPGASLRHLVDHVVALREPRLFEKAIGMSVRTLQRHKDEPARPLNQEQSGRM